MPSSIARRSQGAQLGYNLAGIAMLVGLLGVGLAYAVDALGRSAGETAPAPGAISRSIGDRELLIPAAWFRHAEQRSEAFTRQIDLQLDLPLAADGGASRVEVTLLPRSRAQPSARLLDRVYLHQFLPEQLSGPPGLVGKPLRPADGFAGETVWYDPLAAAPFVAKCSAPVAENGESRCLRTLHLGSLAVVTTFSAETLEHWRAFDAALLPRLAAIGVK